VEGAARAAVGETVWVCVDRVKPDLRDEYRRFLFEVKAPAVRSVRPEAHGSVRLLEPAAPNPDGTWPFIWIMDPVMPGEDYDTAAILEAFYGPAVAAGHMRRLDEMCAEEQSFHEMIQTDW
jgi:hypothetical protein